MKKISIILLVFMCFGMQTYSQTCTLQTLSSVTPGPVQLNLYMNGFNLGVSGIEGTLQFDTTKLTFISVSDKASGFSDLTFNYPSLEHHDLLSIQCYPSPVGELYPNIDGILCKLNFTYNGTVCTNLTFGDWPLQRLIIGNEYFEYTVSWVNGQVCGVPTGIDDNTINSSVEIYPTIAKEKINIKYNVPENGKITFGIFNLLGDEIKTITKECVANNESTQEMNVSYLNSGIYFIKYQIETANINTIKTEKITVTR